MKTRLSYAASALLSLLLCAVMLCGTVLPITAQQNELPSLDYSNPAIESQKSISACAQEGSCKDRTQKWIFGSRLPDWNNRETVIRFVEPL